MSKIIIYTDGGARGNPGIAGAGAVAYDENGIVLFEISKYLGNDKTNNFAEYEAIILALKKIIELDLQDDEVEFRADSKLAIEQLSGNWKVKDAGIREQFNLAKKEIEKIKNIKFVHIPREQNKRADELANIAMDSQN